MAPVDPLVVVHSDGSFRVRVEDSCVRVQDVLAQFPGLEVTLHPHTSHPTLPPAWPLRSGRTYYVRTKPHTTDHLESAASPSFSSLTWNRTVSASAATLSSLWQDYYDECGYEPAEAQEASGEATLRQECEKVGVDGNSALSDLSSFPSTPSTATALDLESSPREPSAGRASLDLMSPSPRASQQGLLRRRSSVKPKGRDERHRLLHGTSPKSRVSSAGSHRKGGQKAAQEQKLVMATSEREPSVSSAGGSLLVPPELREEHCLKPTANCQRWSRLLHHALVAEDVGGFSLPRTASCASSGLVAQSLPVLSIEGDELEGFADSRPKQELQLRSRSLKTPSREQDDCSFKTAQRPAWGHSLASSTVAQSLPDMHIEEGLGERDEFKVAGRKLGKGTGRKLDSVGRRSETRRGSRLLSRLAVLSPRLLGSASLK